MNSFENHSIIASSVDELVRMGTQHVLDHGDRFTARAGSGLQAYGTAYALEDGSARLHTLRAPQSTTYLARELYAYFRGSLAVEDGLAQAAPFWRTLCDSNGHINSNYGYYVFRKPTEDGGTQLDWVRDCFKKNPDTRKAFIGINGIEHKTPTLDFPCTVGMLFNMRRGRMNCEVMSRSTDVITGLPYDIGFFSLVNELVAGLVSVDLGEEVLPGYTAMRTAFTQIYDKTAGKIEQIMDGEIDFQNQRMPAITHPEATLDDIVHIDDAVTPQTETVLWVCRQAGLEIV